MIEQARTSEQVKVEKVSVAHICGWVGISRQAYYQQRQRDQAQAEINELILEQVRSWRKRHPRMGSRKLLDRLQPWMKERGCQMGRDRFIELLRENDLLIERKPKRTRTTWAGHWRCQNLLAETTLTGPHQAYVSDITYIQTDEGFVYLTLITDAYSRFIVGFNLSDTLATDASLKALSMALKQRPRRAGSFIFHSDRGVQFTDRRFRDRLAKADGQSSMGATGDCYDNALAERMNGILKLEYRLEACFPNFRHVRPAVNEAVWLYNFERPHLALGYATPAQVHHFC